VKTYPSDTVVYAGAQVPLLATSTGTSYVWTPTSGATGLNNLNIADPVATVPHIEGCVVYYKVITTTLAGSLGKAFVKIQAYKRPDIFVVTGFTPNGDGKNETFIPFQVSIRQLNYLKVFNPWVQMLYTTSTLNKGWDDRFVE
jgi:CHU_C Type IX secretion signal domain